ncbi:FHA domain-containing protein [Chloroflexus sp. Y-396-1]|uniref:FHA domain-containing protein n=1 Tax=Chloroflexus sp. Y-396-1 TaxID=867845 RepID=UPI00048F86B0|nr:FHA domain-containing protein [Chloroflexus sp. Y-396-1]
MSEYELWRYFEQYAQVSNIWWYSVAVLPATVISGGAYFLMAFALRRSKGFKIFFWLCFASLPIILVGPSFYVSINLTDALRRINFQVPANIQQMSRVDGLQVGGYLSQLATLGIIGAALAVVVLIAAIIVGGYAPPTVVQTLSNISQRFTKTISGVTALMGSGGGKSRVNSKYGKVQVVESRASFGQEFGIVHGAVIGKAGEATILITDEYVSRRHAQFEVRDDKVYLHDLGSRNGTFVERDGQRHQLDGTPYEIQHGDKIYLGHPSAPEAVILKYERS